MPDINVSESALLYAYFMKHSAAWFKANKPNDQMLQMLSKVLEAEAKEIETLTMENLKAC